MKIYNIRERSLFLVMSRKTPSYNYNKLRINNDRFNSYSSTRGYMTVSANKNNYHF